MYDHELEVALTAARRAGELALGYWRKGIEAESKKDESPVTAADRHCERLFVQELLANFPADGVLGEEGAGKAADSGRRWIIDPIDGTRDFVRGNRFWAQLLGLEVDGEVVVGVAHFPALGETYWATKGGGAFRDGERIGISSIATPDKAVLCVNGFGHMQRQPFGAGLVPWMEQFWSVRSYGGIMDAMLVASGSADTWIEETAAAWDLAAPKLIGEEAGARFFNFDGGESIYGGNCVICVPGLEETMRRFMGL
jgi:histidinol phosphatase-like enzyme (inositol monophosphatase family)